MQFRRQAYKLSKSINVSKGQLIDDFEESEYIDRRNAQAQVERQDPFVPDSSGEFTQDNYLKLRKTQITANA